MFQISGYRGQRVQSRLLFSAVFVVWCELRCWCYDGKQQIFSESLWADDRDAIALLQVSAKQYPSSTFLDRNVPDQKDCLNFLHIPKNAGTSIEDEAWSHGIAWGRKDKSLKCDSGFWRPPGIPPGVPHCNFTDADGRSSYCPYWHVPPAMDPVLTSHYNKCDTFCVVRHPVTKLLSELKWENVPCDDHLVDVAVREQLLSTLEEDRYDHGCHWVPQSMYVYGYGGRVTQDKPFCKWVLKVEDLVPEFYALMQLYELPIELKTHHNEGKRCPVNLTESTEELIEKVYAVDYEMFGYGRMDSYAFYAFD